MNEQIEATSCRASSSCGALPPRVLIVGRDRGLLESRAWVIEKGSFGVLVTTDPEEVKKTMAERLDGLILCHSLPEAEAGAIVQRAELDRPNMPVLLLTQFALTAPLAVEAFDLREGPRALLAKCAQLFAPKLTL